MGIDRSVQSGLKSSASHGVHGQAVGVGRSVLEAAKRLAALGPHRLGNVMGRYAGKAACRHKQDEASNRPGFFFLFLSFCLTLADAG